jgi:hypothetical protein
MVGGSTQGTFLQLQDGRFVDDRWTGGRWDLSQFQNAAGETDWDAVSAAADGNKATLTSSSVGRKNRGF